MRLLANTPPGKLSFTIIDPVGLGQNFAGLMHLADYEESLINRRIWTQRDQIEERLAELNEHIEKVIQMYLRNEYASITEYNEQAGSVAEKYGPKHPEMRAANETVAIWEKAWQQRSASAA